MGNQSKINKNLHNQERCSIPFANNPPLYTNEPPERGFREKITGNPNTCGSYDSVKWYKEGFGKPTEEIAHRMGIYTLSGGPAKRVINKAAEELNIKPSGHVFIDKGVYKHGGRGIRGGTHPKPLFDESLIPILKEHLNKHTLQSEENSFRFRNIPFRIYHGDKNK